MPLQTSTVNHRIGMMETSGESHRAGSITPRRITAALACMLVLGGAHEAAGQGTASRRPREYRNVAYVFAVRLPAGLPPIETSRAPNPNHGFLVHLSPTTILRVFGESATTDESTLIAETMQAARYRERDGCRGTAGRKRPTLDGAPARELTFQCPPKHRGGRPTVEHFLMAVRTPREHGPLVYHVGVEYELGSRDAADAERAFRQLVDGFSFTSPPRRP